jgi:putative restriction endonuclease
MRFWWVNQNQTYLHEIAGGYVWSPKRKANGVINPFYESMREVAPGDLVFSFCDAKIAALGIARSHCYECPKPAEFGSAGMNWSEVGWKVDVTYQELNHRIRPAEHMLLLAPLLSTKYSPLLPNGRGNQGVYLAEIPAALCNALQSLIGTEASVTRSVADSMGVYELTQPSVPDQDRDIWESHLRAEVEQNTTLPVTERQAIVMSRRGQGLFRQRVAMIERRCRITGVEQAEHLRASHCKPWRDSSNDERLDGENGLLLTPSIDHLFDRGFIAFEGSGRLLVSPVAQQHALERMGVRTNEAVEVGAFSAGQRAYLEWHQEYVFLESRGKARLSTAANAYTGTFRSVIIP